MSEQPIPGAVSPTPKDTEAEEAAGCVFCAKARDERWRRTVESFEPLNPVTPGHRLFVPREHVTDAAENHVLTGVVFQAAARYAESRGEAFNLITSAGVAATQSVWHLHVHYVPRRHDDGLSLPWTGQHSAPAAVLAASPAVTGPGEALDAFEFTMPKGPYAATRLDPAPPAVTEGERRETGYEGLTHTCADPDCHVPGFVATLARSQHHPKCYQSTHTAEQLAAEGLWATLCDCKVWRTFDAAVPASPAVTAAEDKTWGREKPHTLTRYGTTNCPVEGVRADVDDGECSACGAPVVAAVPADPMYVTDPCPEGCGATVTADVPPPGWHWHITHGHPDHQSELRKDRP